MDAVYDISKRADEKKGREGTVYIRVYENRARRYVSTGVRVLPSQWSEEFGVVRRPDAAALNATVREEMENVRRVVEAEAASHPGEPVVRRVRPKQMKVDRKDNSFILFCEEEVKGMDVVDGTRKNYRATLDTLREFGRMGKFARVTPENMNLYVKFLREREVRRKDERGKWRAEKVSSVCVYDHYKRVRHLVRLAMEKRLVGMDALLGVHCPKGRNREREFLTDFDIAMWMSVKLQKRYLRNARDLFMIQMGTGLSFGDLMEVDFSRHVCYNGHETLCGRRQKTGEAYFVVILPEAVDVLKRLGWKVGKISNQKYNKYLAEVAERAGIDKHVTSHVARHTYATRCLAHGVRIEAVQRTLGHASIKTTQIYAKMVDTTVLEAFDKMT